MRLRRNDLKINQVTKARTVFDTMHSLSNSLFLFLEFYDSIIPELTRRALNSQDSTLICLGPPKSGKSYTFHSNHNLNDSESDSQKNDCYSTPLKVNSDDILKSKTSGLFPKFINDIFLSGENSLVLSLLGRPRLQIRTHQCTGTQRLITQRSSHHYDLASSRTYLLLHLHPISNS